MRLTRNFKIVIAVKIAQEAVWRIQDCRDLTSSEIISIGKLHGEIV